MQKHRNCVNITWILASMLPTTVDCYLGLTPQQPCVVKQITQMDASSPGQSKPTYVPEAVQLAIIETGRYARERISIDLGTSAKTSIEYTNAIQWSTRMQKHFNFSEHVNAKAFQLSTRMHVIKHANAFHLARERISIDYANAKAFQLSFVLRQEHDMLFRVQPGAIRVDLAMSTQGRHSLPNI